MKQKGFTIIEMLIVVAIIGILVAIAVPALLGKRGVPADSQEAMSNCNPIEHNTGSGVWFFQCNAQSFVGALPKFREHERNAGRRIVAIGTASNQVGQYAATVVTEPIP